MFSKLLSWKLLLIAIISLVGVEKAQSQADIMDGTVQVFNRNYQPLTSWDRYYRGYYAYTSYFHTILPWTFNYDNKDFRYATMHASGVVRFNTYYGQYYYMYPYYNTFNASTEYFGRYRWPLVFAFWAGIDSYPYPSYGNFKMGRRVMDGTNTYVFQWEDVHFYYSYYTYYYGGQQAYLDFQVILYQGSNEIEIHYGEMDRGAKPIGQYWYYYYAFANIGFQGNNVTTSADWINVDPNGDGSAGYNAWQFWKAGQAGNHGMRATVRNNADFAAINKGDVVKLAFAPRWTEVYPEEGATLIKGSIYGNGTVDQFGQGDDQKPGAVIENTTGLGEVRRQITGPITFPVHPHYDVVYDATFNNVPDKTLFRYTQQTAGQNTRMFGTNGNLDLSGANIYGGFYKVKDVLDDNGKTHENQYGFNIALQRDLEIAALINPRSKTRIMYPLTARVPVRVLFKNRGLDDIDEFYATVKIYDENGDQVYYDSTYWEADPGEELETNDELGIDFKSYKPTKTGDYEVKVFSNFFNDEESMNNTFPWAGTDDFFFIVAPEFEAEALEVIKPSNEDEIGNPVKIYVGRPIIPQARFRNNGITDISSVPVNMKIYLEGEPQPVYDNTQTLQNIPSGITDNTADQAFDLWTPPQAGNYTAVAYVNEINDDVEENDEVSHEFEVVHAMAGTYTIGPDQNTGNQEEDDKYNARNFTTIQSAVDALYLIGVTGAVTFEFTTNSYKAGDELFFTEGPALDMRSAIVGASDKNTITFKPSNSKATMRSSVVIDLYSGSGYGIVFGQSNNPTNQNAIINNFTSSGNRRKFANSNGFIRFDGGPQKSIKVVLHSSNSEFSAPFFLSQGASNISIKNLLITSATPSNRYDDHQLPLTDYVDPAFSFESNVTNGNSYSAGIVMRSVTPADFLDLFTPGPGGQEIVNNLNLDTLTNKYNVIENNEINGFAYGIASMGIGPLFQTGPGKFARFYNMNNTIKNNLIYNVSRAGIFAGFEENTEITRNKISGVANSTTGHNAGTDVAGIILGGEGRGDMMPYNNIGITLNGNEISNVGYAVDDANNNYVYGIKVEQSENEYRQFLAPNVDESTTIINNAIWGLRNMVADANRIGIRLMTTRADEPNWMDEFLNPDDDNYFSMGDRIVNNTVLIGNDGYNSTGVVAGVAIQHAAGAMFYNNAISLTDDNGGTPDNIYAAVFYYGVEPGEDYGLQANNNIYWTMPAGTPNDQASVYRYYQINEEGDIITPGERDEFINLTQWQMLVRSEYESLEEDFSTDLTNPEIDDKDSELRIDNTPDWPENSTLNNRGRIFNFVRHDIDGEIRGNSGQMYDIGAFEFPGRQLNSDVEVTTTFAPGAYRSPASINPRFSDAEYIMTTAPIEVQARLRNNGTLPQTGINAYVKIYREKPRANLADPVEFYDNPEIEETVQATILSSQSEEITFDLADNDGKEFIPKAFGEWYVMYNGKPDYTDSIYTLQDWFKTMENNVTPLYRIVVSVQSDEDNSNNVYEKVVRFYLKRSMLNLAINVEHSYEDYVADMEINSGRRNYDTLINALKRLSWVNRWVTIETDTVLEQFYDVIERNGWEPRSVNMNMYQTVIWSDGDDSPLTYWERLDIQGYLDAGERLAKKNLLISSQEMVRSNYPTEPDFVNNYLNAALYPEYPDNPLNGLYYMAGQGAPVKLINDNTKWIRGVSVGKNLQQYILETGLNDPDPIPGLMSVYKDGIGLSTQAYIYNPDVVVETTPGMKETTMGVANTSITRNIINLGVDWRHYENAEMILRASLDYFDSHGGTVIPVELTKFDAASIADRVEIYWETAGEDNSDRFEVEKAELTPVGKTAFAKIAEEKAAGRSTSQLFYGPVVDKNVDFGKTYIYRLKMVDLDGQFEYSDEVEVRIGGMMTEIAPNPAVNEAIVRYSLEEAANVEIALYGLTGKKELSAFEGFVNAGMQEATLDVSALPTGTYTVYLRIGSEINTMQLQIVR